MRTYVYEIYDRLKFKYTIEEIGLALDKLNTCYKNQRHSNNYRKLRGDLSASLDPTI